MRVWRRRLHRAQGTVTSLAHQTVYAGRSAVASAGRVATRRPPRWAIWVGLGLAMLLAPGLIEMGRLALRERSIERDIASLRDRQTALLAEKTRLEDDTIYVEGLIRSTFKQSLPGELVIPLESR